MRVEANPAMLTPLIVACLAATWLVWGSTYLAIKFALISFPPFFQMGTRFLLAGALLFVWCRWRGAALPTARQWLHATLIGALMMCGGMGCTAYAERTVSSGLVVAFIAVTPVIIAVLSLAWREVPGRLEWTGIALGLAGVALLVSGAGFQTSLAGLALQSVACLSWSLGSVLSQRVFPLAAGPIGFASEMLCGGVLLMLMAAPAGEYAVMLAAWPPAPVAVAAWLYLVLAGSLLAFNAYMVLLARAPMSLASSYCFVNPVIAMLLGVAVLNEQVSSREWLAMVVILAGVVTLLVGQRRTT